MFAATHHCDANNDYYPALIMSDHVHVSRREKALFKYRRPVYSPTLSNCTQVKVQAGGSERNGKRVIRAKGGAKEIDRQRKR